MNDKIIPIIGGVNKEKARVGIWFENRDQPPKDLTVAVLANKKKIGASWSLIEETCIAGGVAAIYEVGNLSQAGASAEIEITSNWGDLVTFRTPPNESGPCTIRLAWGSCADCASLQNKNHALPAFDAIREENVDFVLLCGDNYYYVDDKGNTNSGSKNNPDWGSVTCLQKRALASRKRAEVAKFVRHQPVIATWDDHDFGWNNAYYKVNGKVSWEMREDSAQIFRSLFPNIYSYDTGNLYTVFRWGPIAVFLIDGRYDSDTKKSRFWGPAQLKKLKCDLKTHANAAVRIIVSGPVFLRHKTRSENAEIIKQITADGGGRVLILSGDVHYSEARVSSVSSMAGPQKILEATCSPLRMLRDQTAALPTDDETGRLWSARGTDMYGIVEIEVKANGRCSLKIQNKDQDRRSTEAYYRFGLAESTWDEDCFVTCPGPGRWGAKKNYDKGAQPCVAMSRVCTDKEKSPRNQVVEVHKSQTHDTLWYRRGVVEEEEVTWRNSHKIGRGVTPGVAMNRSGLVVEVHKSENEDTLWYHVGTLSPNGETIEWGKSTKYDKGVTPQIAINEDNTVVEIHQSENKDKLWCRVGKINRKDKRIDWGTSNGIGKGVEPSIAIYGTIVIETHKSENEDTLWYHVGTIRDDKVLWAKSNKYGKGVTPRVALNRNLQVIEVHKSENEDTLWFRQGDLDPVTKKVTFRRSRKFDKSGISPSVALGIDRGVACNQAAESDELRCRVASWYTGKADQSS